MAVLVVLAYRHDVVTHSILGVRLTVISTRIRNHIHCYMCDAITHPCVNCNMLSNYHGEIRAWISKYIPIYVITYSCFKIDLRLVNLCFLEETTVAPFTNMV